MHDVAYARDKTCSRCKTEKPLDDFPKDASRKDGRMCRCKACDSAKGREYWHQNRKHRLAASVPGLELADAPSTGTGPRCLYCLSDIPLAPGRTVGKRGRVHYCSDACMRFHSADSRIVPPVVLRVCAHCGRDYYTLSDTRNRAICSPECRRLRNLEHARARYDVAKERAKRDKRMRAINLQHTDVTPEHVAEMYRTTKRCPLCDVRLKSKAGDPASREVDHIVPINMGGTHTIGNLRVICRRCNNARPCDGSDLDQHQPTLWAVDLRAASAIAKSRLAA